MLSLLQEFFISLYRDVCNCATGERVESIAGNQSTRALFTVLPPEDLGKFIFFICLSKVFLYSTVTHLFPLTFRHPLYAPHHVYTQ